MPAPASQTLLRRAFVDIVRGYSVAAYDGKPLYIRHLTHREHVGYDEIQAGYEARALSKGADTEANRLAQLKVDGRWSEAKEAAIVSQREMITRIDDTIRNTPQPSVVQSLGGQLTSERAKLATMLNERADALGMTCEAYAQRMVNDYYVVTNLFADPQLTAPLFASDGFNEMADTEVETLLTIYHKAIEACDDVHLRQLAIADFFTSYYSLCGDRVEGFYGRPIAAMTYYQCRLANVARYFRSIMEQIDLTTVAVNVRGDPDAIERLYLAHKNVKELENKDQLPGGMSASDIEQSGLKGKYAQVTQGESAIDMVKRLQRGGRPS